MTVLVAARADDGATWRIVSGSAGSFLDPPGSTVQYEARFDAYAVFGEPSAACPKGGTHDVSTHRHTFSGQTLVHDHPHDGPHGYFGHPEDPTPHEPSDTTGTYELGGSHAHD